SPCRSDAPSSFPTASSSSSASSSRPNRARAAPPRYPPSTARLSCGSRRRSRQNEGQSSDSPSACGSEPTTLPGGHPNAAARTRCSGASARPSSYQSSGPGRPGSSHSSASHGVLLRATSRSDPPALEPSPAPEPSSAHTPPPPRTPPPPAPPRARTAPPPPPHPP